MKKRKAAPSGCDPAKETTRVAALESGHDIACCQCRLVTPMFGGGVATGVVDRAMPIRATSIRGQLRFWWRLLNRRDAERNLKPSKALFEAERAIWGGLGGVDDLAKSKVSVQVHGLDAVTLKPAATYPEGKSFPLWDSKDDAYALFPASDIGRGDGGGKRAAELLPAGHKFELRVVRGKGLDETQWQQVLAALRWWGAFGGVGARTRRGAGAVDVTMEGQPLRPPSKAELDAAGCKLALGVGGANAESAWRQAIEKLREFRQGPGVGRKPGKDPKRPGRSRWPEPDSIRKLSGQGAPEHPVEHPALGTFPRAMFGLPIITHFKDKGEPEDTSLQPVPAGKSMPADRMASPLIVRAVKLEGGKWAAGALLLPREHIDAMSLVLLHTKSKRQLGAEMKPGQWWQPEKAAQIRPLQALGTDPLEAFLAGFPKMKWPEPPAPKPQAMERTFSRPFVQMASNGTLKVKPRDNNAKEFVMLQDDARKVLEALSESAQKTLKERKPFSKLDLIVRESLFIAVKEHKE